MILLNVYESFFMVSFAEEKSLYLTHLASIVLANGLYF